MIRAIAVWLLLTVAADAQDVPALYQVTGVSADDILNIRTAPDARSTVIDTLAPDASDIEVVAISSSGRWGQVNTGEVSGWVALRFMSPQPGLPWQEMAIPLTCYGTEPFWSMIYTPDPPEWGFEVMSSPWASVFIADWWQTVSGRSDVVAHRLISDSDDGMAILRQTACSDGMSDRHFALTIDLVLTTSAQAHSGCCSLAP